MTFRVRIVPYVYTGDDVLGCSIIAVLMLLVIFTFVRNILEDKYDDSEE